MKKSKFLIFIFIILATVSTPKISFGQLNLPAASPQATIIQGIGLGEVRIDYGRPSLRGRKMFGKQLPYHTVWRTGANKVTNITLSKAMEINGHKVAAGKYALLSIPAPDEWTIILNKEADAWGAYTYKEESDALRFKVKPETLKNSQEHFTILFDDFTPTQAHVVMEWENTRVRFLIKQDPDTEIMQQISTLTAASEIEASTYLGAANYYFDTGRDLNKALEWSSKALESNKAYWAYAVRAKIAAKLGKCDLAVQDANTALPEAKKAKDMSYVISLEKIVKDCGK